jgi:uncharacterized membrane protein YukC
MLKIEKHSKPYMAVGSNSTTDKLSNLNKIATYLYNANIKETSIQHQQQKLTRRVAHEICGKCAIYIYAVYIKLLIFFFYLY